MPEDSLIGMYQGAYEPRGPDPVLAPTPPSARPSSSQAHAAPSQGFDPMSALANPAPRARIQGLEHVQDDDFDANMAAADAALAPQGPQGPMPSDIIEGQMAANQAQRQAAEDQYRAASGHLQTKANPLAPIARRQFEERQGQPGEIVYPEFEPEPFPTPPPMGDETAFEYQERIGTMEQADLQLQRDEYDKGRAAAEEDMAALSQLGDTRDIGTPGALGMEEAQRQAAEGVGETEIAGVEARADVLGEAAAQQAELTRAETERFDQERDFLDEQREAVSNLESVRTEARAKMEAHPKFDSQRFTKNMKTGQKFGAIIEAMASGWLGNPSTFLEDLNATDLREQQLNYEQAQDAYKDTSQQVDAGQDLYRFYMDSFNDPRAAGMMLRAANIEDMMVGVDAKLAATTVPEIRAKFEQTKVMLEDMLRKETDGLEATALTTPGSFTKRVGVDRFAQKQAEADIAELRKEQTGLRKEYVQSAESAQERGSKVELKRMEGEAKVKAVEAQGEAKIKEKTQQWGAVETVVQDFLSKNPGDIAGSGLWLGGDQDARIATRNFKRHLKLALGNAYTGAAIDDDQKEDINGIIEGDWTELDDQSFRTRMNIILNLASTQRRYLQKGLGSSERRIDKSSELSTFRPL